MPRHHATDKKAEEGKHRVGGGPGECGDEYHDGRSLLSQSEDDCEASPRDTKRGRRSPAHQPESVEEPDPLDLDMDLEFGGDIDAEADHRDGGADMGAGRAVGHQTGPKARQSPRSPRLAQSTKAVNL